MSSCFGTVTLEKMGRFVVGVGESLSAFVCATLRHHGPQQILTAPEERTVPAIGTNE